MKKTLLIALLAVVALKVSAQTNHEKTLKLFKLMGFEKNSEAIGDNLKVFMSQSMAKMEPKKAQELSATLANEIKTLTPKLMADMAPIYEKNFTGDELQKYIDFYSTPEGQKMVNFAPVLQKEMMNTMMTKYLPEMQKRITAKMQEIRSKK